MLCINCSSETSNPRFCSRSCSASYNNKRRVLSLETRMKISSGVAKKINPSTNIGYGHCSTCNELFITRIRRKKYCSRVCSRLRKRSEGEKAKLSKIMKQRFVDNPELHPNRLCAGIKESYPEKNVKRIFNRVGSCYWY